MQRKNISQPIFGYIAPTVYRIAVWQYIACRMAHYFVTVTSYPFTFCLFTTPQLRIRSAAPLTQGSHDFLGLCCLPSAVRFGASGSPPLHYTILLYYALVGADDLGNPHRPQSRKLASSLLEGAKETLKSFVGEGLSYPPTVCHFVIFVFGSFMNDPYKIRF